MYGELTIKEEWGFYFNFYFFNQFIASYLLFLFLIESIIILFNTIKHKKEQLIYRVGRTADLFKVYFNYGFKNMLFGILIILCAYVFVDIILVITNFIITKELMIFDDFYYKDIVSRISDDGVQLTKYLFIVPMKYVFFLTEFVKWIPAIISGIIIFLYALLFYEKVNNVLFTIIFFIFIYIVGFIILDRELYFLIPIFPVENLCLISTPWVGYVSVLIQIPIVLILLRIRRRFRWDEI